MSRLPADDPVPAVRIEPKTEWIRVPPGLLHKRSAFEVFLTHHSEVGGEERFRLVIPRAHSMSSGDHLPSILGVESIRQVGLALCQLRGGVPPDWALILDEASLSWTRGSPAWSDADRMELEVRCRIRHTRLRGDVIVALAADTEILRAGQVIAFGSGRVRALPRRAYQALRRRARMTSERASPPGRVPLSDRVSANGRLTAVLGWPHPDPFFFDHPVDHVPGMILAQAALDAHVELRGRPAQSIALDCVRFAELDAPVVIAAETAGSCCTTVFEQDGVAIARASTDER